MGALIVAILFVEAAGFGPLAGVVTLIVYARGFVATDLPKHLPVSEEPPPGTACLRIEGVTSMA